MIRVTTKEAQENFDFLLKLVERGENVLIEAPKGNVVMTQVAPGRNIGADVSELLGKEELPNLDNLPSEAALASHVAEETAAAHKLL
tara:strand:+ start:6817 stop:7077 length:261 start_codon:yes stop_codon:yes gene_type:complete